MKQCLDCEHCKKNGGSYFDSYHCELGAYSYKRIQVEADNCPLEIEVKPVEEEVLPKKKHGIFQKILDAMMLSEEGSNV